jgi:hypothetical protein
MLLIELAVADGQLASVLSALIAEPKLAAFLSFLVFAGFVGAAVIFRKHRFRFLRERSSDGRTQTSLAVDPPVKEYPPIQGLIEAEVVVEKKKEAS